jgi:hypothetical protein
MEEEEEEVINFFIRYNVKIMICNTDICHVPFP